MKFHRTLLICLSGLALLLALAAPADVAGKPDKKERSESRKESICTGVLSAVDEKENTVAVRWLVFNKSFNLGKDCALVVAQKSQPKLADLRLGESVEVRYQDVDGVAVAHRVVQAEPLFTGFVTAVDKKAGTLTVKKSATSKTFKLADDCQVTHVKKGAGKLDDLKVGQKVAVAHGKSKDALVASRVEQCGEEFTGVICAIDASARTIKAETLLTVRKFNLGRDCAIVLESTDKPKLSDLRIGQKVKIAFEETDGVLVAHQVTAAPAETAEKKPSENAEQK